MSEALAVNSGRPVISKPFSGWPIWGKPEKQAVQVAIESGVWGVGGTSLVKFSNRFAEFQHVNHVLPVANGTVAIEMALEALDIRCGDEVIVPDYTFVATAMAPLRLGIKPILIDVDPGTFNMNPNLVKAAITGKTRAIIPVHFGGHPCDMKQIMHIADRYGLVVIEGCTPAHGAHLGGKYAGSFGEIGTFSF